MSIYIEGVEMPKGCASCPFYDDECFGAYKCDAVKSWGSDAERASGCPLIHVPQHGRLIDEREINSRFDNGIKTISELPFPNDFVELYKQLATEVKEEIGKCHTIIPASEEE